MGFKVDVDNLVTDVRERLCLQTDEKLCSQLSVPYEFSRRHYHHNHAGWDMNVRKWDQFHDDTHTSKEPSSVKNVLKQKKAAHTHLPYERSHCRNQHRKGAPQGEDPHLLLKRLVAEQSLIQEAVRRLKSQKSPIHPVHDDSEDDSLSQHSVDL